jgi:hypothetical protein
VITAPDIPGYRVGAVLGTGVANLIGQQPATSQFGR